MTRITAKINNEDVPVSSDTGMLIQRWLACEVIAHKISETNPENSVAKMIQKECRAMIKKIVSDIYGPDSHTTIHFSPHEKSITTHTLH